MNLAGLKRIAFLSDIHANAYAFSAALDLVRKMDVDALVIMGDMLTYGCEPKWTLELLGTALEKWNTTLISGNHDQIYFNLPRRDLNYVNRLPDWIRESALWTKVEMADEKILTLSFPWQEEKVIGDCFVAHANPHGFGNWGYLNTETEVRAAADVLMGKQVKMGVFGHSHRPGIMVLTQDGQLKDLGATHTFSAGGYESIQMIIANPGSVGQPRGRPPYPTFLSLVHDSNMGVKLELHKVDYDYEKHIMGIEKSRISPDTKKILVNFHRGNDQ